MRGGVSAFHVLRRRRNEALAFLYAFDLLELDGTDLRREPLEVRKATLGQHPARNAGDDQLTMRMIKGDFVVTGPDVEPIKCKPRREARDWCAKHHPASPIEEIGRGGKRAERQRSPYRRCAGWWEGT